MGAARASKARAVRRPRTRCCPVAVVAMTTIRWHNICAGLMQGADRGGRQRREPKAMGEIDLKKDLSVDEFEVRNGCGAYSLLRIAVGTASAARGSPRFVRKIVRTLDNPGGETRITKAGGLVSKGAGRAARSRTSAAKHAASSRSKASAGRSRGRCGARTGWCRTGGGRR